MKRLMLAALAAVFAAGAFGLTDAERARLQASLRAPRLYPGITWEQLQRLHEEQLSKMYVVRDGKEGKDWIQIRDWSAVTCELKALPASQEIPKAYEVEIHRVEPTGDWFARVARKGKPNVGLMVKVVPPKGMAGEVGDVKTLWLVRRRVPIDDAGAVSSTVVWAVIPEETAALGRRMAAALPDGAVIAFTGGLGAGKTAFCRGLAEGLGCTDPVTSPTFAIVNYYRGPRPMAHFDLYRIHTENDLAAAGFYDYLDQGAIVAAEWSENLAPLLDQEHPIRVDIQTLDPTTRRITIEGVDL